MRKRSNRAVSRSIRVKTPKRIVLLVAICTLALLASMFYARWHSVHSRAAYPLKVWNQGDSVQSRNISFRVNSTRTDQQGIPGYWELSANTQFVILNVTFTNKMASSYQLSPIRTMYIQDAANQRYKVSSAPSITLPFGGEVAPGETVTGEVGLIVPTGLANVQFAFDPQTPGDPLILTSIALQNNKD